LGAAALAWWLARTVTRPIYQLADGTKEISRGNFEYRTTVTSHDEIGQLAEDFNRMAGSIETMQTQLGQRAIQLEAANKELEAFSYSISHDLRAPLRAMDGFSRILVEEYAAQLPSEAQRFLGLVRGNAQQMGHLIEDLLAFSRLSRLPLNKQSVAPIEIVNQVLSEMKAEHNGRNVEVKIGDLPACQADPALLRQVWVNLLSNAYKFTQKKESAQIQIGSERHENECIYFIKDNGVGFDMQYANKLFGVFQRLHRAEEYEGTGVGLAIVQRIVHRHGGRAWAEAEVDKGASFFFTLEGGI
jgi:light-regulated signal transduction histidine kinase (bacteriophytochrome)